MRHVIHLLSALLGPPFGGTGRRRANVFKLSLTLASALTGCSKQNAPAEEPAAAHPQTAQLYSGQTIEQWRARIKRIDPRDPQAAALVPGLIALTRDRDAPSVTRRQAAYIMGRIGAPAKSAVPVLIELLREPARADESTTFWAIKALALFGPVAAEAAPALIGILHDEHQPTANREAAIEGLTRIGTAHPRALTTLVELLQKNSDEDDAKAATFRAHAAASLGLIGAGASSAVPALIRATRDRSEPVRLQSVIALGLIGRQAEVAIPALADSLLSDDAPSVRDEAATSLSKIGMSAVPALIQLLGDQEPEVRERAATALRRAGPQAKASVEPLKKAVEDHQPLVRIAAAEALWSITADANQVVPALIRALTDDDRQIRLRAVRQLIAMGPRARPAIDRIKALTRDPRPQVRRAAAEALRKLEAEKK